MGLFSKKEFVPPEIKPLTAEQYQRVMDNWEGTSLCLMTHDGEAKDWMKLGVNVKDNILLQRAIEEIRDHYIDLVHHIHQYDKARKPFHFSDNQKLKELGKPIAWEMVFHNAESLDRLTQANYGFTEQQRDQILEGAPQKAKDAAEHRLTKKEAYVVLGNIIKSTLDAHQSVAGGEYYRVDVPKMFATREELRDAERQRRAEEAEKRRGRC